MISRDIRRLARAALASFHKLLFYEDYLPFVVLPGEVVLLRGDACTRRGQFGGNTGHIVLTNLRILWAESVRAWPFARSTIEIALAEVIQVHRGWWIARALGGARLHVCLSNGRVHRFWIGQSYEDSDRKLSSLKVWEAAVVDAVAKQRLVRATKAES
ncbi:MAG TPA: hypothetical protein VIB47_06385 [Dehalococcoidia bacterium]|jgi:hypothetical protein